MQLRHKAQNKNAKDAKIDNPRKLKHIRYDVENGVNGKERIGISEHANSASSTINIIKAECTDLIVSWLRGTVLFVESRPVGSQSVSSRSTVGRSVIRSVSRTVSWSAVSRRHI